MTLSSPWSHPQLGHGIALAVRFVDVFTRETVPPEPLDVRIASFPYVRGVVRAPWIGLPGNGVIKFVVSDRDIAPVGPMTVSVLDRSGRYASFEPIVVTLPRPLAEHPPTPAASDFLVEVPLWPTTTFRPVAAETTVTGSLRSLATLASVAGLRVWVLPAGDPPGPAYAYTSASGDFLLRLVGAPFAPTIPAPPPPGDPWPPQTRSVELRVSAPPLFAAPVPVVALRRDGASVSSPFDLDLGRNSLLDVTVA